MITTRCLPAIAAGSLILLASSINAYGGGVQSGTNTPGNSSSALPSCTQCHSGSGPSPSRTNGPTTTTTVSDRVLQPSQQIAVTTSATGGVAGTDGGFLTEVSAGTFSNGPETRIMSNSASITHDNDDFRSWVYSYQAPTTTGLVTMTSVGMTCNGSSSSGDEISFSGSDPNATTATPVRLFVLPQSVANVGGACTDGYGNYSVLGANSAPTIGNSGFALELHGAAPGDLAFLVGGFNPPGFVSLDLGALFGLTGCEGYVASSFFSLIQVTSAGSAARAEGSATFPLSIPNATQLVGITLSMQAAYVDPTAQSTLNRSMPFTFSNGIAATFL